MQTKVVFPQDLIAHKEFLIISEVFLCLSYFFFIRGQMSGGGGGAYVLYSPQQCNVLHAHPTMEGLLFQSYM